MRINPQFSVDLFTFTIEILNRELHSLYTVQDSKRPSYHFPKHCKVTNYCFVMAGLGTRGCKFYFVRMQPT